MSDYLIVRDPVGKHLLVPMSSSGMKIDPESGKLVAFMIGSGISNRVVAHYGDLGEAMAALRRIENVESGA